MKSKIVMRLVSTALVVFVSNLLLAQESAAAAPAPKRPRIALVLEGGSSLGLAHIGVLKWFEEHHIPVSYVAGTSMGGLVGGLYATGKSSEDIRKLVDGIDWTEVLQGQTPYSGLSYRRKEDAREYPNKLEFGIRDGLRFPEGFNSGAQVGMILDRVSHPYSQVSNFDDLPVPFGCVGTDLVSGKPHIFRSGSLSEALRSTMSLPGVFSPVRTDDHIFVDGGLLDNLPTDVARQMGADLIVAVHLQVKPIDPQEPLSAFGVLGRSISVVVAAGELRGMENADILITVPLQDYTSMDYAKSKDIIQKGYDATAAKAAILSTLSVDDATWQQYEAAKAARRKQEPVPQFVEVTESRPELARKIEKDLSSNVGAPVDYNRLEDQLTLLTGSGRYSSFNYSMTEKHGQPGLLVEAKEKEYAPPFVRPLINVDGSDYNHVLFSMGARITFTDIGGVGSEWRNDVSVGSLSSIFSEYYRPLALGSHFFVAPRIYAESDPVNLYFNDNLLAEYRDREAGGGLDFGLAFNRFTELRLGYQAGYQKFARQIGTPELPNLSGRTGKAQLKFSFLGLDDPIIPRNGLETRLLGGWVDASPGAPAGYPLASLRIFATRQVSRLDSFYFTAAGGSTFGYDTGIPQFSLGGSTDLAAYGANEVLTNQYYLFRGGYLRELAKLPLFLGDKLYLNGSFEVAKPFGGLTPSRLPMDGVAALVVNTIFGPVSFGGAFGETGHQRFFFHVGKLF